MSTPPPDAARMEEVFHAAIGQPEGSARSAYLDDACGDDAALRERVEALLAAHDCTGPLRMSFATADTVTEARGTLIGRYKLLEQIGEGGFGVVFMAEQTSPVRRRVALKIIKLGMDTKQVVARFEAERQALALMDHPSIAKVFDAGTTDSGRPYFVMELVRGSPITKYCDEHRTDLRERLALFERVCSAVQHAHQKGIIHRDIKPSNVLVTVVDDKPVPKVIDFGIAKATAARLTEQTLFTEFHQMIGTPEYMSPEQAHVNAADIDTRCDVYSLGVLLYELLVGTTPFDPKELRSKAFAEMQRIIREVEPPRPSTRVSHLDALPSVAAARRIEPRKLDTLLRGDLDWIVMKCLEKDRTRRYETATGLAADVLRYLADEPVSAGPPGKAYRLRKFVRRNKIPVLASAAFILVLIAGIVGTTRGLIGQSRQRVIADKSRREAEGQRNEARIQADEAKRQTDIAEAVQRFTAKMLQVPAPPSSAGWLPSSLSTTRRSQVPTVLQVISAAMKELDAGELKPQPLVEAGVRELIGHTLRQFGRFDEAELNLRKSLALTRTAAPAQDKQIANRLDHLGQLLLEQRKPAEAEPVFREALEIQRRISPTENRELGSERGYLELALMEQGKFADAEPLLREELELWRKARPAGHPDLVYGISNLATALRAQRKFDEAEPLFAEALAIQRGALPARDQDIAQTVKDLAWLKHERGKFTEAEPLFVEALAIFEGAFGKDNWDVADTRMRLGSTLAALNRRAEAENALLEANRVISTSKAAPTWSKRQCVKTLVELYTAWDKAEPGNGYDAKARQWKAKLPASRPSE